MKRASLVMLLAVVFAMSALAQTTITGSGGSLVAPTQIGQNITIDNVSLNDGRLASLSCPITQFGQGQTQWNWKCGDAGTLGTLSVNGTQVTTVRGSLVMTGTCSPSGRTYCSYGFTGTSGTGGAVSAAARNYHYKAPASASVTSFSATY